MHSCCLSPLSGADRRVTADLQAGVEVVALDGLIAEKNLPSLQRHKRVVETVAPNIALTVSGVAQFVVKPAPRYQALCAVQSVLIAERLPVVREIGATRRPHCSASLIAITNSPAVVTTRKPRMSA